jgi:hypothetical protein
MAIPTTAEINAAVPPLGEPSRALTNAVLQDLADATKTAALGNTDLSAALPAWKVQRAFDNVGNAPCRVLIVGTSIASFQTSGVQVIGQQLRETYGSNSSQVFPGGTYGGSFETIGDIEKQPYGGVPPIRARLDDTDAMSYEAYADGWNVVYSTEVGGGTMEVLVDGVLDATLDCSGAQSYCNVHTVRFTGKQVSRITVRSASGLGYLEAVESIDLGPGVFIENATMGGSGLFNTMTLFTTGPNRVDGIPIVGLNGADSILNRPAATRPQLLLLQHYTNDGMTVASQLTAILDRMVETANELRIPVVIISENPALAFVTSDGQLTTDRQALLELFKSYGNTEMTVFVDWLNMADYSDKTAYEALAFPTADKTHPTQQMHYTLEGALSSLLLTRYPGAPSIVDAPAYQGPNEQKGRNAFVPDAYATTPVALGTPRQDATPYGGGLTALARSMSASMSSLYVTLFLGPNAVSTNLPSFVDAIAESDSIDPLYGPYIPAGETFVDVGEATPLVSTSASDLFTVVALVRSNIEAAQGSINMFDPGRGYEPRFTNNGVMRAETGGGVSFQLAGTAPRYVHLQYRRDLDAGSDLDFNFTIQAQNLDVFGVWCVDGPVPIVTPRIRARGRFTGPPGYMTVDRITSQVEPGQVFLEKMGNVGSVRPIIKRAIDAVCYRPFTNTFGRMYEIINRDDYPPRLLQRNNDDGTLVYNEGIGAEAYSDNEAVEMQLTALPAGELVTLAFHQMSAQGNFNVRLTNGVTTLHLVADNTWQTGNNTLLGGSLGAFPQNIALTFNMPSDAQAASLGASAYMILSRVGSTSPVMASAVLARGSSAVMVP